MCNMILKTILIEGWIKSLREVSRADLEHQHGLLCYHKTITTCTLTSQDSGDSMIC